MPLDAYAKAWDGAVRQQFRTVQRFAIPLAKNVDVLLVNPNAVRTGLNNLVGFSVALWYEMDLSATTYRPANGRLHRIG